MSTDRASFFSVRSPLLRALPALLLLAAASAGCGEVAEENCASTKGTLEGTAYRWAPPGQPDSEIAPGATVVLYAGAGATPLYGEADQDGKFSIPLDAGTWTVGGQDSGGCETSQAQTITLGACETEQVVVVLDICTG